MLFHSRKYNTDLAAFGINKPFALDRGELVLEKLKSEFGGALAQFITEPKPITRDDALLVHTGRYVKSLDKPETWEQIFELKEDDYDKATATKPLNELFDDFAFKSGGTMQAAEAALKSGLAANLGAGYHHAFPDRGRGFCALNDIAIAIRSLQKRGLCRKVLIVDLDFHQGDGTALIFANDPDVFTLSVHSHEGWPDQKQLSDLDVALTSNQAPFYQEKMEAAVHAALERFLPDLVIYVAGSDPYELDVLPGTAFLKLTLAQMRQRDEFVIDTFANRKIPLAMVFAGGYGPHVWEVHYFATRRIVQHLLRQPLLGMNKEDSSAP